MGLPDLQDHLKQAGTYDDYIRWRNNRPATSSSCHSLNDRVLKTSHTDASLSYKTSEPDLKPEFFYPSYKVFHFHRTASYWCATLFLEGSIIFTISSGLSFMVDEGGL